MKKFVLIILISFLSSFVWSQVVFNKIIEDTIAHITSSVIALDTGYVVLTGTGNQYGIRSYALRFTDIYGDVEWKKIIGDSYNQYWEGSSNCISKFDDSFYSAGSITNSSTFNSGYYLYLYDSFLDSTKCAFFLFDEVWKRAFNVIRNTSGDFFITGQTYISALDDAFMYLIKVDSDGNLIWDKRYGQKNESGNQIIETSDNNILIGGATFSFPTTVTDEDWYLIKLDTAGNVIWEKGFGKGGFLNYDGPVRGLVESPDSNYIACGGYPALRSDTDTYWDGCIRKVSKDGELMWEKFYRSYLLSHTGNHHIHNKIYSVINSHNHLYILGTNYNYNSWKDRAYLAKLDEEGNVLWKRDYYAIDTNTYSQYLVSIKPTTDEGFILAGYGNDYDTHGYDPPQQAWLVKTDSLGLDGLCYTENPELNFDIEIPETICANDTMQVYVNIAGKSAPYTIEFSTGQIIDSIYYPPTFVPVEIGLTHVNLEWDNSTYFEETITEATLSNHEWGQCIAKPVEFYTPHTSGSQQINITVTDAYGESKTITKEVLVNDNCGSGIADEEVNSVNVYPNPAVDNLYLDIGDFGFAQSPGSIQVAERSRSNRFGNAEIFNSVGQLVKVVKAHNGLNVIDVSDLSVGSYIIKISAEDKTYSLGFEKQ
ncbi:MAG: T9SS type A sorting domain-containing protein [Clostridia bacterium]|nr:T9SS type A sorting domain-containing protein [Clostridia bacterium]